MSETRKPETQAGRHKKSGRPGAWARLRKNTLAVIGLVIVAVIAVVSLLAPLLPLADPDATDLENRLLPPFNSGHVLGTDHLGRDMLSRLIWGTRVSLLVGLLATFVAAVVGSFLGIVAGFYGKWVDNILMRGIDMLMAFPYMLLALAIVATLGPGLMNALFAIAIVNIPFFARNVRGVTVGQVSRDYIDAARLNGQSDSAILFSELLPNVMPVIIITISTTIGWMILETAGLSFLGLGAQPPQADLGSMLGEGRKMLITAPHEATLPGLVILFLVIGINLLGDGLRDILDPRLKSGTFMRPQARTAIHSQTLDEAEESVTQTKGAPILKVLKLSTWFRLGRETYKAVNGVGFEMVSGECLGIVGESGSGKSVTALTLLGLVASPPGEITSGSIHYRGENLLKASLDSLQHLRGNRIAYVFQNPLTTLNPLLTVGEQIRESLKCHQTLSGTDMQQKVVELLKQVQIPNAKERARAYPHELSGGMRQRVGIAMALANDPEIIIADEPTTALDVTIQAQFLELLNELRRERGLSLIFITHDFGVVSEVCDRVMVMYAGKVVETGSTMDVINSPLHPYTRRLIDCVPRLGHPD
ncbi:MAG: dipeptide/oligopeptide/nickel ABC transporter permease/ATP-binding protein, partial [bacterium]|nr:dipeptide/oligopeptide/nickel ABC transporter permease/ATP-binding protein [bacterium]